MRDGENCGEMKKTTMECKGEDQAEKKKRRRRSWRWYSIGNIDWGNHPYHLGGGGRKWLKMAKMPNAKYSLIGLAAFTMVLSSCPPCAPSVSPKAQLTVVMCHKKNENEARNPTSPEKGLQRTIFWINDFLRAA